MLTSSGNRNVVDELTSVRPVINASATLTRLGGSLMPDEVLQAMNQAATRFVDLDELQIAAGQKLARMTRNHAAYVSSGAAAGITLTVATSIAGLDPARRTVFPGLLGMARTEVVCHADQWCPYRYAVELTGARIVEVQGGIDEIARAISRRTACVLWFAGSHLAGNSPPLEPVVKVAHDAGVPVIVDAAAQIPPISNLWRFTRELGADAALFSGGKGLRGPQASGLVVGQSRIIEGCRVHGNPHHAIGRPMKAGKEEIAGLVAAVEWSLQQNEPALLAGYERIVEIWVEGLAQLSGIEVRRGYPSEAGQPHSRAIIALESAQLRDSLVERLWQRNPRIAVGTVDDREIALNPQTLQPGEEVVVFDALREELAEIL